MSNKKDNYCQILNQQHTHIIALVWQPGTATTQAGAILNLEVNILEKYIFTNFYSLL